jgi:hypothetical protein
MAFSCYVLAYVNQFALSRLRAASARMSVNACVLPRRECSVKRGDLDDLEARVSNSDRVLHDRIYALETYCQRLEANMQLLERQLANYVLSYALDKK